MFRLPKECENFNIIKIEDFTKFISKDFLTIDLDKLNKVQYIEDLNYKIIVDVDNNKKSKKKNISKNNEKMKFNDNIKVFLDIEKKIKNILDEKKDMLDILIFNPYCYINFYKNKLFELLNDYYTLNSKSIYYNYNCYLNEFINNIKNYIDEEVNKINKNYKFYENLQSEIQFIYNSMKFLSRKNFNKLTDDYHKLFTIVNPLSIDIVNLYENFVFTIKNHEIYSFLKQLDIIELLFKNKQNIFDYIDEKFINYDKSYYLDYVNVNHFLLINEVPNFNIKLNSLEDEDINNYVKQLIKCFDYTLSNSIKRILDYNIFEIKENTSFDHLKLIKNMYSSVKLFNDFLLTSNEYKKLVYNNVYNFVNLMFKVYKYSNPYKFYKPIEDLINFSDFLSYKKDENLINNLLQKFLYTFNNYILIHNSNYSSIGITCKFGGEILSKLDYILKDKKRPLFSIYKLISNIVSFLKINSELTSCYVINIEEKGHEKTIYNNLYECLDFIDYFIQNNSNLSNYIDNFFDYGFMIGTDNIILHQDNDFLMQLFSFQLRDLYQMEEDIYNEINFSLNIDFFDVINLYSNCIKKQYNLNDDFCEKIIKEHISTFNEFTRFNCVEIYNNIKVSFYNFYRKFQNFKNQDKSFYLFFDIKIFFNKLLDYFYLHKKNKNIKNFNNVNYIEKYNYFIEILENNIFVSHFIQNFHIISACLSVFEENEYMLFNFFKGYKLNSNYQELFFYMFFNLILKNKKEYIDNHTLFQNINDISLEDIYNISLYKLNNKDTLVEDIIINPLIYINFHNFINDKHRFINILNYVKKISIDLNIFHFDFILLYLRNLMFVENNYMFTTMSYLFKNLKEEVVQVISKDVINIINSHCIYEHMYKNYPFYDNSQDTDKTNKKLQKFYNDVLDLCDYKATRNILCFFPLTMQLENFYLFVTFLPLLPEIIISMDYKEFYKNILIKNDDNINYFNYQKNMTNYLNLIKSFEKKIYVNKKLNKNNKT